jgi:hypothetical protein
MELDGGRLASFSHLRNVFLIGQTSKKVKVKVTAQSPELVKKRKIDEVTNADSLTPCKKRREMNACREYISRKIDIFKQFVADINFPKIPLMSHWAKQIFQYGASQQYSAERHD